MRLTAAIAAVLAPTAASLNLIIGIASADESCANADQTPEVVGVSNAELAVLCLTNGERTSRGLKPFVADSSLWLAARRHSEDMVARNYFDHLAPVPAPYGPDLGSRIEAAGFLTKQAWGENIAAGYRTPRSVVRAWLSSPEHCANMLSSDLFSSVGVGIGLRANPTVYGSVWTQDFGKRFGEQSSGGTQQNCSASPVTAQLPATTDEMVVNAIPSNRQTTTKVKQSIKLGQTLRFSVQSTATLHARWSAKRNSSSAQRRAALLAKSMAKPNGGFVEIKTPRRRGRYLMKITSRHKLRLKLHVTVN